MKQVTLKQVKQGDFFRLTPRESPVWVRDYYDRTEKGFWCYKYDDVNHGRFMKSTRIVFTDFYF